MDSFIKTLPLRVGVISVFMLWVVSVETSIYCSAPYYNENKTIHMLPNGLRRCCVQRRCAAGTHAQICEESKPETTQCVTCEEEWFQPEDRVPSDQMMSCRKKRQCDPQDGRRVKDNGSTTRDRECECDKENGYVPFLGSYCKRLKCGVGQEINESDKCDWCKPGHYKDYKGVGFCRLKTDCHPLGVGVFGGKVADDICKNATTTDEPRIEKSTHNDNKKHHLIIICGVVGGIMLVGVLLAFGWIYHMGCCCQRSDQSSTAEKRSLHEPSYSDVDDTPETNMKEKEITALPPNPNLRINISGDGPPPYNEVPGEKKTVTPDSGVYMGKTPSYSPNGVVTSESLTSANDIVMDAIPDYGESPNASYHDNTEMPSVHGRRRDPSGNSNSTSRSLPSTADSIAGDKGVYIFNFNAPVNMQNGNKNTMNVAQGHPAYSQQFSTGSGYTSGDEEEGAQC